MHLRTVRLPCLQLSEMLRFYGSVLGLPVTSDDGCVSVAVGTSQLQFRSHTDAPAQHVALNVDGAGFADACAWLQQRLDLHTTADGTHQFRFEDWRAEACYFRDPQGNVLEIIAREGVSGGAPTPLLSISEIGVVCADVRATAATLEAATGLPAYRPVGETFGALGDIHGLLILVPEGREWYPETGVTARPCAGDVEFQSGARSFTLDLSTLAIR